MEGTTLYCTECYRRLLRNTTNEINNKATQRTTSEGTKQAMYTSRRHPTEIQDGKYRIQRTNASDNPALARLCHFSPHLTSRHLIFRLFFGFFGFGFGFNSGSVCTPSVDPGVAWRYPHRHLHQRLTSLASHTSSQPDLTLWVILSLSVWRIYYPSVPTYVTYDLYY